MTCGRVALSVALGLIASLASATAAERPPLRAVVELFTSQGCSSCPAADALLGEFASDPSIVAMSLPIDYWDYLGWKDTLAKPRHSMRQRAYAHMRGDREVYTPQVVVNGVIHVIGSDKAAIDRIIGVTRRQAAILSVPLLLSANGDKVVVTVPASTAEHPGGEIWLCALTKNVLVAIGRGENRGQTVTYHNVVRRWIKLGDWNGAARTLTVPAADYSADGVDAVAVILQAGTGDHPGSMLGAAVTSLH